MSDVVSTKVVTKDEVRFSYAHVWEAKAVGDGGDLKYSVSILIPKTATETIKQINAAVEAAKQAGVGKFGGKIPAVLKLPLRDGDAERPDDDTYAGCYFLNATSKTAPGIVKRTQGGALVKVTDESEFYSGCYGYASINFFAFNTNGNKGIACGLNNLMKTRDGESLMGRKSAEDDFAEFSQSAFAEVSDAEAEDLPF